MIRYEVTADDGHPLRIYSRTPRESSTHASNSRAVLLLHGRTWSTQPVYDLHTSPTDEKQQSTLQSLADLGFAVYALDFRGFGETIRDDSGYTTPQRCVEDVHAAMEWIRERHEEVDQVTVKDKPALLGWSQGALVAQMYAQQYGSQSISDLVLFGSIFDPRVIYPRKPLYDPSGGLYKAGIYPPAPTDANTDVAALEDFTLPGSICDEAALSFSSIALAVDAIKAPWDELHEFNCVNPAMVHVPTMVIVGQQDPYVTWEAQRELFERMATDDKVFCVLPGCDHAAHILTKRRMFIRAVAGFLTRADPF